MCVTLPSLTHAKAAGEIRKRLVDSDKPVPLVADVHHNGLKIALEVAQAVDKLRSNPIVCIGIWHGSIRGIRAGRGCGLPWQRGPRLCGSKDWIGSPAPSSQQRIHHLQAVDPAAMAEVFGIQNSATAANRRFSN